MTLLGVLGLAAGFALAASGPSAPTITSHPANPTTSTSASFSFTDSTAKVTFACSLDGSAFTACASPKSYSGLAAGTHTFRVQAKDASGHTSGTTPYSWAIDLSAPSTAILFPSDRGVYNFSGWSAGCFGGVCGTVSDPSGVASVSVSIRQNATGKYWDGLGYTSASEAYKTASLAGQNASSASWFYALPLPSPDGQYTLDVRAIDKLGNATPSGSPTSSTFTIDTAAPPPPSLSSKPDTPTNQTTAAFSFMDTQAGVGYLCRLDGSAFSACNSRKSYGHLADGTHAFYVKARDAAGNDSAATSYSWVIDTNPPPKPVITAYPPNPSTSTSAQFSFSDSEQGTTFECQLDGGGFSTCTSPKSYFNLSAGSHTFEVRAADLAGNQSGSAKQSWKITSSSGMPFTISGNVPNPLFPGAAAQPIALKLTNPNSVTIYVTSLAASVQATGATGCTASWFQTAPASIATAGIAVPANGSVTVPASNDPTLQMVESHTNQDACKSATLTLSYTGSAHS